MIAEEESLTRSISVEEINSKLDVPRFENATDSNRNSYSNKSTEILERRLEQDLEEISRRLKREFGL